MAAAPEPSTAPVPRVALRRAEAAASLGLSLDSFERHVQPELRIVRRGRLRLVAVAELERWAEQQSRAALPEGRMHGPERAPVVEDTRTVAERRREYRETGGGARSSWTAMKTRCTNPNHGNYPRYGGRGITVCARWLSSFVDFHADMGDRPPGTSIDRVDNDAGYWCGHCDECVARSRPANCRWATASEQYRNRRAA